jgi:hypothetical protein
MPGLLGAFGDYSSLCFVRKVCRFAMKGLPKGEIGIGYTGRE